MIRRIINGIYGATAVQKSLKAVSGNAYRGLLLPLGYRGPYMVLPGEYCLLAGIFNSSTVHSFSSTVGQSGRVVVAEANPKNVERMKGELAELSNIRLLANAIWNAQGTMDFIASDGDESGYDRLASDELNEYPERMGLTALSVPVPTNTIDHLVEEHLDGRVDHINLTINGAELQALDTIDAVIANNPGVRIYINSEIPVPGDEVIVKLRQLGFRVYTSKLIRVHNKSIRLIRIYAYLKKRN
jgi:FkbM family methyltransferase